MADSSILELLAKLMRHEQSARDIGSLAEAESFAAKIQKLLSEHKLDMSEIQFEEREQSEPIGEGHVSAHDIGIKRVNRRVEWQENLASAIAYCNGCQLLITNHANTVFFVGRTSDRQVCAQVYTRFVKMAFDLAEAAAKENKDAQRDKCQSINGGWYNGAVFAHWMRAYKHSFCAGFSSAIQTRMRDQARKAEEQKRSTSGENCSALVHIRKDAEAIQTYLQDKFKDRKPSKAKDRIDEDFNNFNGDGYSHGQANGKQVALAACDLAEKTA